MRRSSIGFRLVTVGAVIGVVFGAWAAFFGAANHAHAAAPWVSRGIVLPGGDVAVDFGLGIGHAPIPGGDRSVTGFGLNLELAAGVTHNFELGVRTGFRLESAGQTAQADNYGRPFDTETAGTNNDRIANPELRFRWAVARAPAAELGLELRFFLPTEDGARFGMMFGVPITLRARSIRVDTGLFVPVVFTDPTTTIISVPVHIWIQATSTLWLGPLFGLKVVSWDRYSHTSYPLGFGLGTMLSRSVDLKTWFLFPDRPDLALSWGAGVALQVRFE